MKNIYHIHQSSNSYWNNEWYDTDYMLCDTDEEYNEIVRKLEEKRKKIDDEYAAKPNDFNAKWRHNNFRYTKEGKVHASEYYYAHEWQGKTFDAVGVCWYERLERSSTTTYYLKPGSVSDIKQCTDPGIGWMYGS